MSAVGSLYRVIIDDVIKNVKAEFTAEGLDDNVIQDLQMIWETKVQHSGAVNLSMGDINDYSHGTFPYDLSVYSSTSFIPGNPFPDLSHNPLYNNMNTQPTYINNPPLDVNNAARPQYTQTAAASTQLAANALRSLNSNMTNTAYDNTLGKPQQYMAPNWTAQNPTNTNSSSSATSGSIQNILRQQDGAGDAPQEEQAAEPSETRQVDAVIMQKYEEILKRKAEKKKKISQLDGNSDDSDDESDGGAGGDEELDSDLDDDDDAEPETENFVLCQYEKVTRIKNKRKTNLKDGIMHLNGRDAVFHKATGEFDW